MQSLEETKNQVGEKDEENTSVGTIQTVNSEGPQQVQQNTKFAFINQGVQDWPQWTVDDTVVEQEEPYFEFENNKEKLGITKFLVRYMHNRGMTQPIRKWIMEEVKKEAKVVKEQNQKKPEQQRLQVLEEVDRRLSGWKKRLFSQLRKSDN